MICGNCKERGVTVSHVKDCYDPTSHLNLGPQVGPDSLPEPGVPIFVKGGQYGHIYTPAPVTEPGVYFDGERYYKVVFNQSRTRLYAKVWDAAWEYAPGALRDLTADMRVSAEQAARFGKLWGSCVFCTRSLTDERSIFVGYGPVCADKNGLPWGEAPKPVVSVESHLPPAPEWTL